MITLAQFRDMMPTLNPRQARKLLPHLLDAMNTYRIDKPKRIAAFLAQVGFESHDCTQFEDPGDGWIYDISKAPGVAEPLGNTAVGDGPKYKPRGALPFLGKNAYTRLMQNLSNNFVAVPELVAAPEQAFRTAAWLWHASSMNTLAEAEKFDEITLKLAGALVGRAERMDRWARAKRILLVTSSGGVC